MNAKSSPTPRPNTMPSASECTLRANTPMRIPAMMPLIVDPITMPAISARASGVTQAFRVGAHRLALQIVRDVGGHLPCRLVARVRIRSHCFLADCSQWTRHAAGGRRQLSRCRSRQHERQDRAEREDIGAGVYLSITARLFGRYVTPGTEDTALTGYAQRVLRRPYRGSDFGFRGFETSDANFREPP